MVYTDQKIPSPGAQSHKRIREGKHGLTGGTLSVTRLQSPSGDPQLAGSTALARVYTRGTPRRRLGHARGAPPGSGASEAEEATAGAGGRRGEVKGLGRARRTPEAAGLLWQSRARPPAPLPFPSPAGRGRPPLPPPGLQPRSSFRAHELVSVQPQEGRPLQQVW